MDTNCSLQFQKRSQLFIGMHDEALSVVAMRVSDEYRSTLAIHGCNTTTRPTGFAEVVSDYFSIAFHANAFCRFCAPHGNDKLI
jgi:hypothetical protein